MSKPLSPVAKQIRRYLKKGYPRYALFKMGYSKSTVRYHFRALFFPERYSKLLEKQREQYKKRTA